METRATLLEQVLKEVYKLSVADQELIAQLILEELSERGWQKRFEATGDILDRLADEALKEHRDGLSEPLDPDNL